VGVVGAQAQGGFEAHERFVHPPFAELSLGEGRKTPALPVGPFAVGPPASHENTAEKQQGEDADPQPPGAKKFQDQAAASFAGFLEENRHPPELKGWFFFRKGVGMRMCRAGGGIPLSEA
jgi:hypothetical protein